MEFYDKSFVDLFSTIKEDLPSFTLDVILYLERRVEIRTLQQKKFQHKSLAKESSKRI